VHLDDIYTGMKFKGRVVSVIPNAAFIDIGVSRRGRANVTVNVNGFLHKSEIGTGIFPAVGSEMVVYIKDVFKNSRFCFLFGKSLVYPNNLVVMVLFSVCRHIYFASAADESP
jgi:hypothetical protein